MHELIASNKRRSVLLVVGFVIVVALVGGAFGLAFGGGIVATVIALVVGGVIAFGSYWKADTIALAVSRAHPADPQEYARLHNIVEGLCIASGLPKPRVYIVDDPAPNAFATGRNPKHAAIAGSATSATTTSSSRPSPSRWSARSPCSATSRSA
jgi:heat shock protein HtpX